MFGCLVYFGLGLVVVALLAGWVLNSVVIKCGSLDMNSVNYLCLVVLI